MIAISKWMPLSFLLFISVIGHGETAPDPRDTTNPYGVLDFLPWNDDWNHYFYSPAKLEKAAALMQEAGIGMVRTDFLWKDIEPQKGRFDFTKYDRILDTLDRHGIKALAILEYNPVWREAAWNAAPVTEDYVAYAAATVRHFKGRVRYWEIWNEPDSKTYWEPQDSLKRYSVLLKAVYPVIKQEDPTAQVVLGGLTETGPYALRHLYQLVGKDCFDIVGIHPFVNAKKINALQSLRGIYYSLMRVMTEFGDQEKPIWFTELGCPGVKVPTRENAWWEGFSDTEEEQAQWVTTIYSQALHWKGVQRIFWAFFRQTDGFFRCGVDNFGLVREDFSKKPAYEAYKKIAAGASSASDTAHRDP